jgi:hypothetical protein
VSLRVQCCMCGGRYPEHLWGWRYVYTGVGLQLGADGEDEALQRVPLPELVREHLCGRKCALEFEDLIGGRVEVSWWVRAPEWLRGYRRERAEQTAKRAA